jgi:putative NIF3 family GTP cyclohydrolase 1 type 2
MIVPSQPGDNKGVIAVPEPFEPTVKQVFIAVTLVQRVAVHTIQSYVILYHGIVVRGELKELERRIVAF